MTMTKTIQTQLYEKTNHIKELEIKINKTKKEKFNSFVCLGLLGGVVTITEIAIKSMDINLPSNEIISHFPLILGSVAATLPLSLGIYRHIQGMVLNSQLEQTNLDIEKLREAELHKNLTSQPILREFQRIGENARLKPLNEDRLMVGSFKKF